MPQAIDDIQAGKYVDLEITAAYDTICQTQSLGSDWSVFLSNAPSAVLHTEFHPPWVSDVRDYVLNKLRIPDREERENLPLPDQIERLFDEANIYVQNYDISVEGTKGKVFISRTPTEIDFDRARAVVLFVLEFFNQASHGGKFASVNINPDVTLTIRGTEKFFDINIKSGINDEAWVGFDFR